MNNRNYRLPALFIVVLLITTGIVLFIKGTKTLGGTIGPDEAPLLQAFPEAIEVDPLPENPV